MKHRFFRILWRINAILICLASVLVVFVCAFASYYIFQELSRSSSGSGGTVAKESDQAMEKKLTISDANTIEGTNVVRCSLDSVEIDRAGSFSCSTGTTTTHNFLYCELLSGATHWLLPNNNAVILEHHDFCVPPDKEIVRWTSYRVVDQDTNHDGVLSGSDLESFAVSQPNGTSYTVLITGIENVMESKLVAENKLIVVYRKKEGVFYSMIDLNEMKVGTTLNIFEKK